MTQHQPTMQQAPADVRRGVIERAWRAGGRELVDLLAWGLAFTWITPEENPELVGAREAAVQDLARLAREPKPLARPVVVLNGYHAWAGVAESVRVRLAQITSGRVADFHAVSFMDVGNFARARTRVLREVEAWVGLDREVDVVGISMGGLVARYCASHQHPEGKRLRAQRLFTLASPHRGAKLARKISPDDVAKGMKPGSEFLQTLDASPTTLREVHAYAHLRDVVVGATNTSPQGAAPLWSSATPVFAHFMVMHNPIMLASIARSLRGEDQLAPKGAWTQPGRD